MSTTELTFESYEKKEKGKKETMPYSDKIMFVVNAADIPNPFGKSVKYSIDIVKVNLDGEFEYRIQLRLQGNKNKFATIVYGNFSDLESATKAGKEILTAFRRRRKIETYIMVEKRTTKLENAK